MAARDDGATKNEASMEDEEVSCGTATGATEWVDAGATVACDTTMAGRDAALAGCLTG